MKKCLICKKDIIKRANENSHNFQKRKYCSHDCYYKSRKGVHVSPGTEFSKGSKPWNKDMKWERMTLEKNPAWKGGKYKLSHGYIMLISPDHPYSYKDGYILEHRFVCEKELKRFLDKDETPHHINGIRDDNRPENLFLFNTMKEHSRYHGLILSNKTKPITKSNLKNYKFGLKSCDSSTSMGDSKYIM